MTRNLINNFNKAITKSSSSRLEVSWAMGTNLEGLEKLLSGETEPTVQQQEEMIRYIFKTGIIMNDKDLIELFAQARTAARKYYKCKGSPTVKRDLLIEAKQLEQKIDSELKIRGFEL